MESIKRFFFKTLGASDTPKATQDSPLGERTLSSPFSHRRPDADPLANERDQVLAVVEALDPKFKDSARVTLEVLASVEGIKDIPDSVEGIIAILPSAALKDAIELMEDLHEDTKSHFVALAEPKFDGDQDYKRSSCRDVLRKDSLPAFREGYKFKVVSVRL